MAVDKALHAFGNSANLQSALNSGAIDAYDILFLDGDTEPKVGWIDKNGVIRIVDNEKVVMVEGDALPDVGVVGKIYIQNENSFFWNGTEFKPLAKSADLSGLEGKVTTLEEQMNGKVDSTTVETMINTAIEEYESANEIIEF